jgi:hypothetical protein
MFLKSYHLAWLQVHPEHSADWLESKLREGFHVHHVDFDNSNDAPDNLVLVFGTDHLANLHGWKMRPRKPGPAKPIRAEPIKVPRPARRRLPSRAHANPPSFKRDPAVFVEWQQKMGYSNGEAARALHVSPNTITDFRRNGATAKKTLEMWAIVLGIKPDTPWDQCRQIGILTKALKEMRGLNAPLVVPAL